MTALYNEIDPKAAAWLRALISAGHIAPGIVDERSIEDLTPDYLRQFTQVHLFAGIGVWSYALRRAGFPDTRRVWTASFPCQPFSSAGKGDGFVDERHLWPAGHWLIQECEPELIVGEQVASKDAEPWLDLVQADLEGLGYAFGACAFPSAGVGAPHIRDRTYWVADTGRASDERVRRPGQAPRTAGATEREARQRQRSGAALRSGRASSGLANNNNTGLEGRGQPGRERGDELAARPGGVAGGLGDTQRLGTRRDAGASIDPERGYGGGDVGNHDRPPSATRRMADSTGAGRGLERSNIDTAVSDEEICGGPKELGRSSTVDAAGPTNGLWRNADWLYCRDNKWRPVEPSTFPLAHGSPARVGRLRGYGNALNAEAAALFIACYLDAAVI